jgi:hypothetical protein
VASPTFPGWRAQILTGIGAPITPGNLGFLNAWQQAENSTAAFNPLDTTWQMPGATPYNTNAGHPVWNYTSPQQGVAATVRTLLRGASFNPNLYMPVVQALRQDRGALAAANALSPSWGTNLATLRSKILAGTMTAEQPVSVIPIIPIPAGPFTRQGFVNSLQGT